MILVPRIIIVCKIFNSVFECGVSTTVYSNIGSLTWPSAKSGDVVTVNCKHGGTAQRVCENDRWSDPILLDCNSNVSDKVDNVLDEHRNSVQVRGKHHF